MKTFKAILIIILVLAITTAIQRGIEKRNERMGDPSNNPISSEDIDLSPEVNARQLCYIWNTEAGDKAMLSMDIRGDKVIGEFNWLPSQKDKKTGIFKGTVSPLDQKMMARTANVFWDTKAEGMTATEELKIIFGEGTASPGFGEMRDRGDGVYVYANPESLDYSLNLSQTDCGDEAMD